MAKFGVFSTKGGMCSMEYEGDYMTQDKQFVQIMKKPDVLVAAIHLDKGESVKLMVDE